MPALYLKVKVKVKSLYLTSVVPSLYLTSVVPSATRLFRAVFNIYTGKKCSEYLFCGMNDMKAARPSKRARLTEEGTLCSWRSNY